ncbi:hypothetical protein PILCRDRAFT_691257 [Piloderma croceum F 1598]|uniref:Uncharacterized protein n=1 Tax=Piloderma croceum (strain F 1598) TaxID=765440 RepID=A0A0C3F4U1_PILCF|nr:hypothetical protein PILCRDRAFT_691257 [Piloderma croceum F 1598]
MNPCIQRSKAVDVWSLPHSRSLVSKVTVSNVVRPDLSDPAHKDRQVIARRAFYGRLAKVILLCLIAPRLGCPRATGSLEYHQSGYFLWRKAVCYASLCTGHQGWLITLGNLWPLQSDTSGQNNIQCRLSDMVPNR